MNDNCGYIPSNFNEEEQINLRWFDRLCDLANRKDDPGLQETAKNLKEEYLEEIQEKRK